MLRDLLRELLDGAPDVVLVPAGPAARPDEGPGADVYVMTTETPENEAVPVSMLLNAPRSRVLALSSDARQAFLYELRPHRTALGELSRDRLLDAVRAALAGGRP